MLSIVITNLDYNDDDHVDGGIWGSSQYGADNMVGVVIPEIKGCFSKKRFNL
jgi:hypothetical protein